MTTDEPITVAKYQLLRAAIKKLLTDVDIWPEEAVIDNRQTDVWQDVAVAVQGANHGCVLVIGIESSDATEEDSLESDLVVAVTLLGPHNLEPGAEPEEVLFEKTLRRLHNAIPIYEGGVKHWAYRLRYQRWRNASEIIPDESFAAVQLARQAVFKVRFSLEPDA